MDTWALNNDENWGDIVASHQEFFTRFLMKCAPHSYILDAACGTGKYWAKILAAGHHILGVDQSQGMLSQARAKFPNVLVEIISLQDLKYEEAFDNAVCMDAMELIIPEDWILVLRNFFHAIKPAGYFYFTVEILQEQKIMGAYEAGKASGLPIVYGEWVPEGRYHFYPRIERVKKWLQQSGFTLVDEMIGDEYHHFLVQKRSQ